MVQDDRKSDRVDEIVLEIGDAVMRGNELLGGIGRDEARNVVVHPPEQHLHVPVRRRWVRSLLCAANTPKQ